MWTDLGDWFRSADGTRVLQTVVIPAAAIVVAGVIAGLIARAAVRSAMDRADREQAVVVIAGLVEAARTLTERDVDGKDRRRRAARLRSEMDVRARLLPMPGATLAADWAGLRLDALQRSGSEQPQAADLEDFRTRLTSWGRRPRKARALFAQDVVRWRAASEGRNAAASGSPESAAAAEDTSTAPRRMRSGDRAGSLDAPAAPAESVAAPRQVDAGEQTAAPAGAAPAAPNTAAVMVAGSSEASSAVSATPAWRRARAVADARSGHEEPSRPAADHDGPESVQTAPVVVQQHAHRAEGGPAADADDAARTEARQSARRERDGGGAGPGTVSTPTPSAPAPSPAAQAATTQSTPAQAAPPHSPVEPAVASASRADPRTGGGASIPAPTAPSAAPAPSPNGPIRPIAGAQAPAWLDTYDDEAEVTQTMNLKTPPPVAAMSVRDRNRSGDDIVPRQ